MTTRTEIAREARAVLDRSTAEGRSLTTEELDRVLDLIERGTDLWVEEQVEEMTGEPIPLAVVLPFRRRIG